MKWRWPCHFEMLICVNAQGTGQRMACLHCGCREAHSACCLPEAGPIVVLECVQHIRLQKACHALTALPELLFSIGQATPANSSHNNLPRAVTCQRGVLMTVMMARSLRQAMLLVCCSPAEAWDTESRGLLCGEHDGLNRPYWIEALVPQKFYCSNGPNGAQRSIIGAPQLDCVTVGARHDSACAAQQASCVESDRPL